MTVQAGILQLLRHLQRTRGMAVLLISHDWGVIGQSCRRAYVMYAGMVVEAAPVAEMLARPAHPYTLGLRKSMPRYGTPGRALEAIPGTVPTPGQWPAGCHFAARCPVAMPECGADRSLSSRPEMATTPGVCVPTIFARAGMAEPLLTVTDLVIRFRGRRSAERDVLAVDGVSLQVEAGETLGLVGESGSGKSTIGNAVLGLVPVTSGQIQFQRRDITHAAARDRRQLGQHIQVIFQDPYGSLNPVRTIGQTLTEPLRVVARMSRRQAVARAVEVLAQVGLPSDAIHRYPAAFSGGQRQRVAVARALVMEPELVICDEPTSALDLSVQAQILNLLLDLQARLGLTYVFISHDIDVVRHMSHRVAVLLAGRVVECGAAQDVIEDPTHEYTRRLIDAVPELGRPRRELRAARRRSWPGPQAGLDRRNRY